MRDKKLEEFFEKIKELEEEQAKRIVGQKEAFRAILICLFSWGLETNFHLLFEGVPGIAKTMMVKALAKTLGIKFARLQMTAELLPSDIIGYEKINPRTGEAVGIKKGPIFTNLLLVDEINRASEKPQAALLEGMQEGQVTIGDQTFVLEQPFLMMATQNPLEHTGTRPLGAAQLDRFLTKVQIGYPEEEEEIKLMELHDKPLEEDLKQIMNGKEILELRELIRENVYRDPELSRYIVRLVRSTRPDDGDPQVKEKVEAGASPRGSIYISAASKVSAFLVGRDYVLPEDIEEMARCVLPHRIRMNPGYSEKDARDLIEYLIKKVAGNEGKRY